MVSCLERKKDIRIELLNEKKIVKGNRFAVRLRNTSSYIGVKHYIILSTKLFLLLLLLLLFHGFGSICSHRIVTLRYRDNIFLRIANDQLPNYLVNVKNQASNSVLRLRGGGDDENDHDDTTTANQNDIDDHVSDDNFFVESEIKNHSSFGKEFAVVSMLVCGKSHSLSNILPGCLLVSENICNNNDTLLNNINNVDDNEIPVYIGAWKDNDPFLWHNVALLSDVVIIVLNHPAIDIMKTEWIIALLNGFRQRYSVGLSKGRLIVILNDDDNYISLEDTTLQHECHKYNNETLFQWKNRVISHDLILLHNQLYIDQLDICYKSIYISSLNDAILSDIKNKFFTEKMDYNNNFSNNVNNNDGNRAADEIIIRNLASVIDMESLPYLFHKSYQALGGVITNENNNNGKLLIEYNEAAIQHTIQSPTSSILSTNESSTFESVNDNSNLSIEEEQQQQQKVSSNMNEYENQIEDKTNGQEEKSDLNTFSETQIANVTSVSPNDDIVGNISLLLENETTNNVTMEKELLPSQPDNIPYFLEDRINVNKGKVNETEEEETFTTYDHNVNVQGKKTRISFVKKWKSLIRLPFGFLLSVNKNGKKSVTHQYANQTTNVNVSDIYEGGQNRSTADAYDELTSERELLLLKTEKIMNYSLGERIEDTRDNSEEMVETHTLYDQNLNVDGRKSRQRMINDFQTKISFVKKWKSLVRLPFGLSSVDKNRKKSITPDANVTMGVNISKVEDLYKLNQNRTTSTTAEYSAFQDLTQYDDFDDVHLSQSLKLMETNLYEIEFLLEQGLLEIEQLSVNFYDRTNQVLEDLLKYFHNQSNLVQAVGQRVRLLYEQLLQQLRDYYGQMYETYLDKSNDDNVDVLNADTTGMNRNNNNNNYAGNDKSTAQTIVESLRNAAQNAVPDLARERSSPFYTFDLDYVNSLGGLMSDMMKATEMRQQISYLDDDDDSMNDDDDDDESNGGMRRSRRRRFLTDKQRKFLKKIANQALVLGVNYLQGWLAWQGIKRAALERERSMPKFPLF